MPSGTQTSDASGGGDLSIAVIGPDPGRLSEVASALAGCQLMGEIRGNQRQPSRVGMVQEFSSYPVDLKSLPALLEQEFDVIIIDLDSNPEFALDVVRSISSHNTAAVM